MIVDVEEHAPRDRAGVPGDHVGQAVELRLQRALVGVPGDALRAREHLVGDVVVELRGEARAPRERVEHPGQDRQQEPGGEEQCRAATFLLQRAPRGDGDESGRQEHAGVVAREEGERGERAGPGGGARARAGEQDVERGGLQGQGERVGRDGVAVAEEGGVRGDEERRAQAGARIGAPAEQRGPEEQRERARGHREEARREEEVPHDESGRRERDLVARAHHAVARRLEAAVLDEARALCVLTVEVGLGHVVADAVGTQHHAEQGHAQQRDGEQRQPPEQAVLPGREARLRVKCEGARARRGRRVCTGALDRRAAGPVASAGGCGGHGGGV